MSQTVIQFHALNNEIVSFLKEVVKKNNLRAYVATPSGYQQYYPKHWYTVGAKMAYERGTIIKPIAGWNHYILKNEEM